MYRRRPHQHRLDAIARDSGACIAPCRSRPHVIDTVRPGDHPGDQAGNLHQRVHSAPAGNPHVLTGQIRQARPLSQHHHRDQARPRRRMGSSNVAWIFARSCNNRTCEVSSQLGIWKRKQLPSSQFRGNLFASTRPDGSSLSGRPRPPQPDATAVLAAVKVVRPTGRSTLTTAAGRRSQAATTGKEQRPGTITLAVSLLTFSSVVVLVVISFFPPG